MSRLHALLWEAGISSGVCAWGWVANLHLLVGMWGGEGLLELWVPGGETNFRQKDALGGFFCLFFCKMQHKPQNGGSLWS